METMDKELENEPSFEELQEANRELEQELNSIDMIVNEIDKDFIKDKATGDEVVDTVTEIFRVRSEKKYGKYLADKYKFEVVFMPKHLKKGMKQHSLHLSAGYTIRIVFEGNPISVIKDSNFVNAVDSIVKMFPSLHKESALMILPGKSINFDSFKEVKEKIKKAKESWIEESNRLLPDWRVHTFCEVSEVEVMVRDAVTKLEVKVKGKESERKELELKARILLTKKVRESMK